MMPFPLLNRVERPTHNDRGTRELRDYVRSEWSGDGAWLRRVSPRRPIRTGLLTRLFHRAARSEAPPLPAATPAAASFPAAAALASEDCPHDVLEDLGSSGFVEFLRCCVCGAVLVTSAGRRWTVNAADVAPSEDFVQA